MQLHSNDDLETSVSRSCRSQSSLAVVHQRIGRTTNLQTASSASGARQGCQLLEPRWLPMKPVCAGGHLHAGSAAERDRFAAEHGSLAAKHVPPAAKHFPSQAEAEARALAVACCVAQLQGPGSCMHLQGQLKKQDDAPQSEAESLRFCEPVSSSHQSRSLITRRALKFRNRW